MDAVQVPKPVEQLKVDARDLLSFDPKCLSPEEYIAIFAAFLREWSMEAIHNEILLDHRVGNHFGLIVRAQDLIHHDPAVARLVFTHPALLLPLFEEALVKVQEEMVVITADGASTDGSGGSSAGSVKRNAHVRVQQLPASSELCKRNISAIRNNDLNLLLQVQGTVVRTGAIKMLEFARQFQCQNKTCGRVFFVRCDMSQGNMLPPPKACPGQQGRPCKGRTFAEFGSHRYSDYQEVKIQEQAQRLGIGSIPRSILILLQDDLVDSCKAGDDVEIVGTLLRRWTNHLVAGVRCEIEVVLLANSVRVNNATDAIHGQVPEEVKHEFERLWADNMHRPLAVRNHIAASVCPQIYGLFTVKLAVLLTLIGGVSERTPEGMYRRGTPHLLIIGDPGCGKSQFLRFAAKLSPRAVVTTGVGTTSAGLTCSAVKDGGEWSLEAGALVLADRGLCCIDEFSAIREHDRATIHEAMEQQTLSVAKAGMVCKLNARTTVFAVTNPKGTYDTNQDVTVNTAIGSPLLSRFDLVLLLLDTKNKTWDIVVSTFILRQAMGTSTADATSQSKRGSKRQKRSRSAVELSSQTQASTQQSATQASQASAAGTSKASQAAATQQQQQQQQQEGGTQQKQQQEEPVATAPWNVQKLQRYLSWVKEKCPNVQLSGDAERVLARYYHAQRSSDVRSAARTTIRLLESLIRLAQAHARLMARTVVTLQDAVSAVATVETSLHSSAMLGLDSVLHSDFPADPDAEYPVLEQLVLEKLGLVGDGDGDGDRNDGGSDDDGEQQQQQQRRQWQEEQQRRSENGAFVSAGGFLHESYYGRGGSGWQAGGGGGGGGGSSGSGGRGHLPGTPQGGGSSRGGNDARDRDGGTLSQLGRAEAWQAPVPLRNDNPAGSSGRSVHGQASSRSDWDAAPEVRVSAALPLALSLEGSQNGGSGGVAGGLQGGWVPEQPSRSGGASSAANYTVQGAGEGHTRSSGSGPGVAAAAADIGTPTHGFVAFSDD